MWPISFGWRGSNVFRLLASPLLAFVLHRATSDWELDVDACSNRRVNSCPFMTSAWKNERTLVPTTDKPPPQTG